MQQVSWIWTLGQGLPATAQVNAADLQWQSAADLQKVGEAKLSVLFWDVYYSRLYTDSGSYQRGQRPLKLEIEYLLDIKSAALVDRTRKEWDDQGLSHENQEQWLTQLLELWPDVAQNDVLVLELEDVGQEVQVEHQEDLRSKCSCSSPPNPRQNGLGHPVAPLCR